MTAASASAAAQPRHRAALFALAAASFGIGMGEFVIVGLLPNLATDLRVPVPRAGLLISAYALSVAFGSPFVAVALHRLSRLSALLLLMAMFCGGSIACALAPSFAVLLGARVLTALSHGAFFGIGAVVALEIAPPGQGARAVALLFTGMTLANVVGVPAGSWIGQSFGWRTTFAIVALIGAVSLAAIARWVPRGGRKSTTGLRGELVALKSREVWLALLISAVSSAALFAILTFLTPFLEHETGFSPHEAAFALLVFGLGLTAGGLVGGRLADHRLLRAVRLLLVLDVIVLAVLAAVSATGWAALAAVFAWGCIAFALVPPLQTRVVSQARNAPHLASTFNQSAFNLGDAAGAALGAQWLTHGFGYATLPLLAAGVAAVGLIPAFLSRR
ncbi:MAG TPA: MFS transporter [Acidisoma sp.]|uniref:MFS transporter n=1 Tax=Acidisoma sp. TaxID=1872115 RepID=UPI002C18AAF2|nr:MFS transporter [Acidisoma sp.]HTI02611.1 MFS transporter [Acidisoma sp.]